EPVDPAGAGSGPQPVDGILVENWCAQHQHQIGLELVDLLLNAGGQIACAKPRDERRPGKQVESLRSNTQASQGPEAMLRVGVPYVVELREEQDPAFHGHVPVTSPAENWRSCRRR